VLQAAVSIAGGTTKRLERGRFVWPQAVRIETVGDW
jgi:hypothetical protein